MAFRVRAVLTVCAMALAGCSTIQMSEADCAGADWFEIGQRDGRNGEVESIFDNRAGQCSAYGFAADEAAYVDGRGVGLFGLCRPDQGFEFARKGNAYRGVCPVETEVDFLTGYLSGQRIAAYEEAVSDARSALSSNDVIASVSADAIDQAREILAQTDLSEKEIKKQKRRLRRNQDSLADAQYQRDGLIYELGRAEEALAFAFRTIESTERDPAFIDQRFALLDLFDAARGVDAIDYCETSARGENFCRIRAGAEIADERGAVCAIGPGEATQSSYHVRSDDPQAERVLTFYFFPLDERGNRARAHTARFDVRLSASTAPNVSCFGPY